MANSLKDALVKAGVVKKDSVDLEKDKARREKIQSKGPSQEGIHAHHIRTDCAHCGKSASDVEYYEHFNRSIEAKWLCMVCADKGWIKDECRQTNQSSHAKAGKFRREFGATKRFPQNAPAFPPPKPAAVDPKAAAASASATVPVPVQPAPKHFFTKKTPQPHPSMMKKKTEIKK
jgi:hypothetical protein